MIKEKNKIFGKLVFLVVVIGLCLPAIKINAIPIAHSEVPEDITNQETSNVKEYKISTIVYTGNKLGKTTEIAGYRIFFYDEECTNGSSKYYFYRIEFADPVASVEELEWHTIPELSSFIIFVSDYNDLWNVTEDLNQINHTTLESYYVYNTLMDILMYDLFEFLVLNELVAKNKTSYVLESYDITLPDWKPLITNLEFQIEDTYISYISGYNQKNSEKIFFYKNDESFIKQSMVYKGLAMPTEGTSRYMGFIKLNSNNDLIYGTLSEYFMCKVNLFKFFNLYSLNRREQTIELLNE